MQKIVCASKQVHPQSTARFRQQRDVSAALVDSLLNRVELFSFTVEKVDSFGVVCFPTTEPSLLMRMDWVARPLPITIRTRVKKGLDHVVTVPVNLRERNGAQIRIRVCDAAAVQIMSTR